MKEIRDTKKLEQVLLSQCVCFGIRPPVLRLLAFEKGELLNHPLKPLDQFLIIVKGNILIYYLSQDGSARYISRAGFGALLGDMEFSGVESQILYTEAIDSVLCLAVPFQENRSILERDPVFLRFVLNHLAEKLSMSTKMDVIVQTLEEKVLLYLRKIRPDHEIRSVNETMQTLHCSRRQLQRVLKGLCEEGILVKTNRGCYRLKEDVNPNA